MSELVYLAAPYSHPNPAMREFRFRCINKAASTLMRSGVFVLSPVSHSHPIAISGNLPPGFDYWGRWNRELLRVCKRMLILELDGWKSSEGIKGEIEFATDCGIPYSFQPVCPACGDIVSMRGICGPCCL